MHDILMAVRGDGSTVKRIGIVDRDFLVGGQISPNLLLFRTDSEKALPYFLFFLMTSERGQHRLRQHVTRTAKKTITATAIKMIEIPVPPLDLQREFDRLVGKIRKHSAKLDCALGESENLFHSLTQRAFRGEL